LKELITFIAEKLVDKPEDVDVVCREEEDCITIELRVAKEDLGKVIGKQGRTARAMRTVLATATAKSGKRSRLEDYRVTNRGGKGVKTLNISEKTGELIAIKGVTDNDDLMIINKSGITIRMSISNLRVMGRATQGVRLIKLQENDEIAAVAKVEISGDEEVLLNEEENGEEPTVENSDNPEEMPTDN